MQRTTPEITFLSLLQYSPPQAIAFVNGSSADSALNGIVKFYAAPFGGVLIDAEIFGLPDSKADHFSQFFAMHIHENGDCSNGFANTGNHFNPTNKEHPNHAGDLPPLFSSHGYAWMAFYDKRLSIHQLIGRSLIIHSRRDDFTSQPSGDSGDKIACGVIAST